MSMFPGTLTGLRHGARLSQSELARRSGFNHSHISRLEGGARIPTRDVLYTLSRAMRLTPFQEALLITSGGFLPDDTAPALVDVIGESARYRDHEPCNIADLVAAFGDVARSRDTDTRYRALIHMAVMAVRMAEAIDIGPDVIGEEAA